MKMHMNKQRKRTIADDLTRAANDPVIPTSMLLTQNITSVRPIVTAERINSNPYNMPPNPVPSADRKSVV